MYIAKEIYEWVAKSINYDFESLKFKQDGEFRRHRKSSLRKPQDPLFVYENKLGVCVGKSSLVDLMMRIAKIPSIIVATTGKTDEKRGHAYNAVYLNDDVNNRKGWTLLDSTWGSPEKSDVDANGYADKLSNNRTVEFFPAVYDNKVSFQDANKAIVSKPLHRINDMIATCDPKEYCYWRSSFDMNIDGIVYQLCGLDGDSYIELRGISSQLLDSVHISPGMLQLGLKLKIGEGIKSIILDGDEDLDLSEAVHLENVDTTKSNKYERYDKDTKQLIARNADVDISESSAIEKQEDFVKKSGKTDEGVNYTIVFYSTGNNAVEILFGDSSSDKTRHCDALKIPEFLKKYNVPIKIQPSITSLILKDDDTVDLSRAKNLEKVDVSNSNKYILSENVLYEKNTEKDDLRGDIVYILKRSGKFEDVIYTIQTKADRQPEVEQIFLMKPIGKAQNVKMPKFLTKFRTPITICDSIESIILESDDIVDLSYARDLKGVDVTRSQRYEKRNDKLFDKVENKEIELRDGINIIDNRAK